MVGKPKRKTKRVSKAKTRPKLKAKTKRVSKAKTRPALKAKTKRVSKAKTKRAPRTTSRMKIRERDELKLKLQHLVGKALTDERFRLELGRDPVRAGLELDIRFDEAQVDALRKLHPHILESVAMMERGHYVACGPGVLIPIADVGIVSAFT